MFVLLLMLLYCKSHGIKASAKCKCKSLLVLFWVIINQFFSCLTDSVLLFIMHISSYLCNMQPFEVFSPVNLNDFDILLVLTFNKNNKTTK